VGTLFFTWNGLKSIFSITTIEQINRWSIALPKCAFGAGAAPFDQGAKRWTSSRGDVRSGRGYPPARFIGNH
jgi:hypothetical protein